MATKVITGLVRFSYANVWEPKAMDDTSLPKYGVSILIPKSDTKTIAEVQAAIAEATELAKSSKFGGKVPPTLKNPLRDGDVDRPDDEAYVGHMFFNANSNEAPKIVDANVKPIMDRDEFYSGCFGRASVTFYGYNANGSKGIAAGLQNVQKLKDGERLSGGSTPEDDFGSAPVGDDLV